MKIAGYKTLLELTSSSNFAPTSRKFRLDLRSLQMMEERTNPVGPLALS